MSSDDSITKLYYPSGKSEKPHFPVVIKDVMPYFQCRNPVYRPQSDVFLNNSQMSYASSHVSTEYTADVKDESPSFCNSNLEISSDAVKYLYDEFGQPIHEETKQADPYTPLDPKLMVEMPALNDINQLMRCAACTRIPLAQGFICTKGHLLCRRCGSLAEQVGKQCPVELKSLQSQQDVPEVTELCQAKLEDANFGPLAQLFQLCKYKCPCVNCDVSGLSGLDMDEHTQFCKWRRMVQCPDKPCDNFSMPFDDYGSHLQDYHKVFWFRGYSLKNLIVSLPSSPDYRINESWPLAMFSAFNHQFIIRIENLSETFIIRCYLLDSRAQNPNKHDDYQVRFSLRTSRIDASNHDQLECVKWVGPVLPFIQEIDETGYDEDKNALELVVNHCKTSNSPPEVSFPVYKEFVHRLNPYPLPPEYTMTLDISIENSYSFGTFPKSIKFSSQFV